MWQGWDLESNDSDEGSDSDEDWINVGDGDGPLVISDSEDEKEAKNDQTNHDHVSLNLPRVSTLATSKVSFAVHVVFVYSYAFLDFDTRRFRTPQ